VPEYSTIIVDWSQVTPLNWLRLAAAMYLVCFSSGYCILGIFNGLKFLKRLSTFLVSFLLSVFFSGLFGFILLISHYSIEEYGLLLFVSINLLLSTIFLLRQKMQFNHAKQNRFLEINIYDIILVLIGIGTIIGAVMINLSNSFLYGVQNYQIDQSLTYMKSFAVSLQGNSAGGYDYWFFIFVATLTKLSGFPAANAFLSLLVFACLPTFAVFEMTSQLTRSKKLALIVAGLMNFQGFGWIAATSLMLTNSRQSLFNIFWNLSSGTYEFRNSVVWFPNVVDPIFIVALPVFCLLVYLSFKKDSFSNCASYLFISPLVALGYLSHHYEIVFFIIIYSVIISISQVLKIYKHNFHISFSIMAGLLFVAAIDLVSPGKQFVIGPNNSPMGPMLQLSSTYAISIFFVLLPIAISCIERVNFLSLSKLDIKHLSKYFLKIRHNSKIALIVSTFIVIFYLFFVAVWLTTFQRIAVGEYSFVPIYAYPVRFGINGLMAIVGIIVAVLGNSIVKTQTEKKFFWLMMTIGVLAFGLGRLSSIFNFLGSSYEARLGTFFLISLAAISAFIIRSILFSIKSHIIVSIEFRRKLRLSIPIRRLAAFSLIIIVFFGFISTTFLVEFWSVVTYNQGGITNISQEEAKALTFVKKIANPNDYVLTVSSISLLHLTTFCGLTNGLYYPGSVASTIINTFWSVSTLDGLSYLINKTGIKYIYLAGRDIAMLKSSTVSLLSNLVNFLPLLYSNSEAKILQVSDLAIGNNISWVDQDFNPSNWKLTDVQNATNVNVNLNRDVLSISGQFDNNQGYVVMKRELPRLSTENYPFFEFKWMGLGNVASIIIYYTDGTMSYILKSQSIDYWTERFTLLQQNKTLSSIELRADNHWSLDKVKGDCFASYASIEFLSFENLYGQVLNQKSQNDNQLQTLSFNRGNINLVGKVKLDSSAIDQITGDIFIRNSSITNVISKMSINGDVAVIGDCENASVSVSEFGSVARVFIFSPLTISLKSSEGSTIMGTQNSQILRISDGYYTLTSRNGSEPIEVLLEKPYFEIEGSTTFNQAFFWPLSPRCWGANLEVMGTSMFSVTSSDLSMSIIVVDGAQGGIHTERSSVFSGQRDELKDIYNFIISPLGVLSIVLIFWIGVTIFFLFKKFRQFI
jgi:hypothetical protein